MADMLSSAAAWLDGMRRDHLSHYVSYRRGGVTTPCLATISKSTFETQSELGVIERWESRDFIISADDLPVDAPQRGDQIVDAFGGRAVTYEVCSPRGQPVFTLDAFGKSIRVFAKAIMETQS